MYTEICVAVELKENVPQQVVDTIKWLAGDDEFPWNSPPNPLPDHKAFTTDESRMAVILRCGSYYFAANRSHTTFYYDDIGKSWRLIARANLKNYHGEIEGFLAWLGPYIEPRNQDENGWQFIGHKRYEEFPRPTLIFVNDEGAVRYEDTSTAVVSR